MSGATSKAASAMPGGWGKDGAEKTEGSYTEEMQAREAQEQGENLVAGIVGKSGEDVVDETGKTVGKITEGGTDLVGCVVTATGDIISKDGGIVGKASPLKGLTGGDGKQSGVFGLVGATKGVKGVVDTVDGTVRTVNQTLPLVGDLTKGLGLGGSGNEKSEDDTKKTESAQDPIAEILGQKPTDEKEKEEQTEEAKAELFEAGEKTEDAAPINLKDLESKGNELNGKVDDDTQGQQLNGKLTDDNTQTETDADEAPKDDKLNALDDVDSKAKDVADTDAIKDDTEKKIPDTDEVKDKVPDTEETKGDLEDKVPDTDDVTDEAKDKVPDTDNVTDEAKDKLPEDGKDIIPDSQFDVETVKSAIPDDLQEEPLRVEGDKLLEPFKKFPGAEIDDEGKVIFDNQSIGRVVEGDKDQMADPNITIDPEGRVLNENESEIGRVELKSELEQELVEEAQNAIDLSALKGAKVNKAGNLVNDKNEAIGRITSGILRHLIGRKADANGVIWNDAGQEIGKAELIPENEREDFKEPSPFEDFPDAVVQSNGEIHYNGEIVGRLIEGDAKKLKGKKVDSDGDVLDRQGNKIGAAERWEPEPEAEPEPEPEVDKSILAGTRVNKGGYLVSSRGDILGRVIEGDVKRMVGRMSDKQGFIRSESGDVLGKAELVPEGEREGLKEGPFAELVGCTVRKDGMVITPGNDVVGKLVSGDPKVLVGRAVDEDGDILDANKNAIGHAERYSEPEVEKKKGPMAGLTVNKEGNVYDGGNLVGKLTVGEAKVCAGMQIDDDGDVVNSKGQTIGHVNLIEDIPEEPKVEEEKESPEDKKAREDAEADKKLAKSLGICVEQCLDKIRPICKLITSKIDKAERTPKDELDEEELVKQVKPLIEEGSKILNEANGTIRALDPDGRIQRNAKHKSATRDASPEEYHLADVLKELTGTVSECIDGAKRKIEDMPHAKKELNPLWGLLTEPLFQILAAVGLLLTGVLGIVGRLLSGLGLGGLVDGLLGSLGLTRLLDGLGVGSLVGALTGKNQKKK